MILLEAPTVFISVTLDGSEFVGVEFEVEFVVELLELLWK